MVSGQWFGISCSKISEPRVPLSAYKELSFFKLFFVDIGLLGAMSEFG